MMARLAIERSWGWLFVKADSPLLVKGAIVLDPATGQRFVFDPWVHRRFAAKPFVPPQAPPRSSSVAGRAE